MNKKQQTWVIESDYHSGSGTGLNGWKNGEVQVGPMADKTVRAAYVAIQHEMMRVREDAIKWFGQRPDVVVVNGDATEGEDPKGHDVLTKDPDVQAELAARAMVQWNAKSEYILVEGTKYHCDSNGYPIGVRIASMVRELQPGVKVTFVRKLNTSINGWFRMEARHKVGRSEIPHGRNTAPARDLLWNVVNAAIRGERKGEPAKWPHLIVRSHVHYWMFHQDSLGAVLVTPAWKALGCRYGDEECSGEVTLGTCKLTIGAKEEDGWNVDTRRYLPGLVSRGEAR